MGVLCHALALLVVQSITRAHEKQYLRKMQAKPKTHRVELCRREYAGGDLQRGLDRVHSVKERFLVLLEVLVVGRRDTLERGQEPDEPAHGSAALSAEELECVRVLLLRHEGGARGVGIAEGDKTVLARAIDDEVLCQAAKVDPRERCPEEELGDKVPIADSI